MDSSAFSMGWPSITSSSENTPTTKALSHSSGESSSAVSNSIRRPRTTAVWPTAGGVPPAREVVKSRAAQRNSFLRPRIITAWRNEVISQDRPNPEELMKRSRLKDSVGSFLSRASISSVLACWRTRLISWMMVACVGRMVRACTSCGWANQKPWNSRTPRSRMRSNCSEVSTFSATIWALVWARANFTRVSASASAKVCMSSLMKAAAGSQLA